MSISGDTDQHEQHDDFDHDDFGGLRRDITGMIDRRKALSMLGVASAGVVLAACGSSSSTKSPSATTTGLTSPSSQSSSPSSSQTSAQASASNADASAAPASAGAEIPSETGGPFPADGTNGPNVLETSGVERADITKSIGDFSGTAVGIPVTIELTIADAASGAPMAGAAVYLWHCTADGQYSIYQVTDQNYLRGLQVADANGVVKFQSVMAGCYSGRWPHVHFEVYSDAASATNGRQAVKVSQLAYPQDTCEAVYADSQYTNSASNLSRLSLDTDMVFRDGWTEQLATMSGDNANGYTATLVARV